MNSIKAALLGATLILTGCVDDAMHIQDCASVGDIRPVCGMQSPEDIAALPDERHLLLANFGGMHGEDGKPLDTIEKQTVQTFRNLEKALNEIGLTLKSLLKITVILKDISDFHGMHAGWKQVFDADYPVRTTITSDFIDDNCLIQIEGVAGI